MSTRQVRKPRHRTRCTQKERHESGPTIDAICKKLASSWFKAIRRYGPHQSDWDVCQLLGWYDACADLQDAEPGSILRSRLPRWFEVVCEINDNLIAQLETYDWEADLAAKEAFCDWLYEKAQEISYRQARNQVRAMVCLIRNGRWSPQHWHSAPVRKKTQSYPDQACPEVMQTREVTDEHKKAHFPTLVVA